MEKGKKESKDVVSKIQRAGTVPGRGRETTLSMIQPFFQIQEEGGGTGLRKN
jgi:hypothetical protein